MKTARRPAIKLSCQKHWQIKKICSRSAHFSSETHIMRYSNKSIEDMFYGYMSDLERLFKDVLNKSQSSSQHC